MIREADFPAGWKLAKISDVAEVNPRFDKNSVSDDLEVSFVPMPAVAAESGAIDVTETRRFATVKKGYTGFLEGDVLFAKITPCMENGKMAVVPALKNNVGFGSTEFHVLRPKPGILPEYLYYFVSAKPFRYEAEHNMTGAVGQKRVPAAYLSGRDIPVPPSDIQRRIVDKIEALFSELDKGIESLKTAREQLKIYRQAVLKHAFEGKLTARWREENADKLESPEQLLARIQQEREAHYQQQLQEWKAAVKAWEKNGKEGKKPGRPRRSASLKEVPEDVLRNLPSLPVGWTYIRLGEVIDEPNYGTSKKCDYGVQGKGVLRIPNIVKGVVDASDLKFACFDDDEIENYRLQSGDLLTIRSNGSVSLVGRCALISEKETQYLYAGYLIRLRPNANLVYPEFLLMALSSHCLRSQIEGVAKSTSGVNNINAGEIQHLIVPICDKGEQYEMLQHIERVFPLIDLTENEIERRLLQAEILRQSILNKALSGKLVIKNDDG